MNSSARVRHRSSKRIKRKRKNTSRPFLFKIVFDRALRRRRRNFELCLGVIKIERVDRGRASAFYPSGALVFIRDEPVQTRAQIGSKLGFRSIVAAEKILFYCLGEKGLSQVPSVFALLVPLKSDVFVD